MMPLEELPTIAAAHRITGTMPNDFEMHWKYKFVTQEGNSGVQFRSKLYDEKNFSVGGYQADCDAGRGRSHHDLSRRSAKNPARRRVA